MLKSEMTGLVVPAAPPPAPVVVAPQIPTQPLLPRARPRHSLDSCLQFLDAAISTTNNSGDDISIVGCAGNRTIESARTINVTSVSGDLIVLSATNVEHILSVNGTRVENLLSNSGQICLRDGALILNAQSVSGTISCSCAD